MSFRLLAKWHCMCKWRKRKKEAEWIPKEKKMREMWSILFVEWLTWVSFECASEVKVLFNDRMSEINYQKLSPEDKCCKVDWAVVKTCKGLKWDPGGDDERVDVSVGSLIIVSSIASQWIIMYTIYKMAAGDVFIIIFYVFLFTRVDRVQLSPFFSLLMCDGDCLQWNVSSEILWLARSRCARHSALRLSAEWMSNEKTKLSSSSCSQ